MFLRSAQFSDVCFAQSGARLHSTSAFHWNQNPQMPRVIPPDVHQNQTLLPSLPPRLQQHGHQVPGTPSPSGQTSTRRSLDHPHPFEDTHTDSGLGCPGPPWQLDAKWYTTPTSGPTLTCCLHQTTPQVPGANNTANAPPTNLAASVTSDQSQQTQARPHPPPTTEDTDDFTEKRRPSHRPSERANSSSPARPC